MVNATAGCSGCPPSRVADLLLVATELATNSLNHAGVRAGWRSGTRADSGLRGPRHGLLGRPAGADVDRPPQAAQVRIGLFVVDAIADLLRTYTTPAARRSTRTCGTTILPKLLVDGPRAASTFSRGLTWGAMVNKSTTHAYRRRGSDVGDRRVRVVRHAPTHEAGIGSRTSPRPCADGSPLTR